MFVFVVFFFKQKTAYEMRISDWSSDVCSSDLAAWRRSRHLAPARPPAARPARRTPGACAGNAVNARPDNACFHCGEPLPPSPATATIDAATQAFCCEGCAGAAQWIREIGRASCRERVCQYV